MSSVMLPEITTLVFLPLTRVDKHAFFNLLIYGICYRYIHALLPTKDNVWPQ